MNRLMPLFVFAAAGLMAIGCTQQHASNANLTSRDLRQPTRDIDRHDVPAHIRGIGASDAAGAVLWDRGHTATAYLLRPGMPDTMLVYDEVFTDGQGTLATVPTR
jgi:hypothetical protein